MSHAEKTGKVSTVDINVSNLDRASILHAIRGAYRLGGRIIKVTYRNTDTPHLRKDKHLPVQEVIREEASKLIGAEIVSLEKHHTTIRVKNTERIDGYRLITTSLRRTVQMHEELMLLFQGHLYNAPMLEENHNAITRIVSYGIREMNTTSAKENSTYTQALGLIDKMADLMKYAGRDYLRFPHPLSQTAVKLSQEVHTCLILAEQAYAKPSTGNIASFSLRRDDLKRRLQSVVGELEGREAYLLGQTVGIVELLVDLVQLRMLLHYQKESVKKTA
jgi:hypothetical protein